MGMRDRLDELARSHRRPVTIIGWSLGGIFSRELARERPEAVWQVITLGSPFRLTRHGQTRARGCAIFTPGRWPAPPRTP